MANVDQPSPRGNEDLESGQPGQVAPTRITIAATDPVIETVVGHEAERKQHSQTAVSVETPQGVKPETGRDRGEVQDRDLHRGPRRDEHQGSQRVDADRAPRREEDGGDQRGQAGPQPQQPSMMKNLLITAAVALVCGVIGAMAYAHFFGSKSDRSSSSQTKHEAGANQGSSSRTKSGGGSHAETAPTSTSSSVRGSRSAQGADALNEQIKDLTWRIDRLGERVDRLQQLLSLAVPLLQRIAPKD
jgi:hypothetical protein